jgi:hypothetical protein
VATTSPTYQLDINGTLRSVNGANFATTSGNVGIGTASPSAKFDVDGVARVIGSGSAPSSGEGIEFQYAANQGEVLTYNRTGSAYTPLRVRSSTIKLYGGGGAGGIDIATSGNVGIGTASPAGKLVVVGASSNTYISIDNAGSGENYYASNAFQQWQTAGSARMTLTSAGELLINTTTDAGDYKLQVAGNIYATGGLTLTGTGSVFTRNTANTSGFDIGLLGGSSVADAYVYQRHSADLIFGTDNIERMRLKSDGEFFINTTTDAGDYKLQVVGNARIGTGKLDISSNTTFSMNVQRSGTSEVAGTFNNSNGILYLGAESSAGGAIFTGSSSYAAVIGSGAAYPLQFATNNVVRASINADGEMLIGGSDVGLYNLQVTGNAYTQTFQYVGSVLGINTGTYNSAGTAQITMKNGTNPDGSVTDQFILYSADVVAGNAAPHFRTENGGIIKLYQETTAVGAATFTANSGTAVNDASTFDGYTLKQIVKALRNQGILQ